MTRALACSLLGLALLGCTKRPPVVEPAISDAEPAPTAEPAAEPVPSPLPAGRDIARDVTDAVALLTVGQPDSARRARDLLAAASRRAPDNASIQYNLGVAHDQLGDSGSAERAFREALRLDPELARAWLGLGLLAERRGDTSSAVENYRSGAKVDPDDMELRAATVGALRRGGRHDEAIREARAALAHNTKSLLVFNELGLVYLDKGDLPMAEFVYTKAISQVDGARNSAQIRSNLGWVLNLDGKRIRARRQLEEAHRIDATYLPALVYLASFYLDDRNFADAVPLLEAALAQEPENAAVLLDLGVAYRGVGQFEKAKASYEKALQFDRSSPDPHMNLGILLADNLKEYPSAIEAFRRYIEANGRDAEIAREHIASIEREQERIERRRQQEAERREREAARKERERLLQEGESDNKPAEPAPAPPSDPSSPWGPQ